MADPAQNSTNSIGNLPNAPPVTPEFAQAKSILPSLSIDELRQLREDAQSEIDHRIQEQTRQREEQQQQEEEERRQRDERRKKMMYDEWVQKYLERGGRKDGEWEEKQEEEVARRAKALQYGSMTEDDSDASGGSEADGEDGEDLDSENDDSSEESIVGRIAYDERHLRNRFEYELANPKIYPQTINEGERIELSVSARIPYFDDESYFSGTSPAPSGSEDSERGGGGGQDDLW
ncbi:cilia- and flagella-associated protein 251-like [Papaver somniferum]|uniref:cilia- and flagella-associated protein 251-like n=1 Tax=Papaver somniferum TaxID=3469 RepID=UPI000E703AAA|nr:cilia- and flagella-associated protein 251-like [Papaver somniferum]